MTKKESLKELKSELKFHTKLTKYHARVNHAISSKDSVTEASAREELDALLSEKSDGDPAHKLRLQQQVQILCPPGDVQSYAAMQEARLIFSQLLALMDVGENDEVRRGRIEQTEQSIVLCRSMRKGRQEKSMFQNATALRGYARQKFHGRMKLTIHSLAKISPNSLGVVKTLLNNQIMDARQQEQHKQQQEIMRMCWEKLGRINQICSIGCGPGSDAVGLLAFLRSYVRSDGIDDIFMLDYAIDEWKEAVLNDLVSVLERGYVKRVRCESCDVAQPLASDTIEQIARGSDMFLASYVLTETRGKSGAFWTALVRLAKVGAIFYFAEPVTWMLHHLLRMSSSETASDTCPGVDCSPLYRLRFVWLDTSAHFPEMQKLDRRCGPAVLMAIKT